MNAISPHPLIARGRTADVYAWGEGQVLKLYQDWFDRDSIAYEARLGQAVHACGLPVPAVGEIVQVNGHNGLIYERVDGPSMQDAVLAHPWRVFGHARRLARLHADMHASRLQADLPAQRPRLERKIRQAAVLPSNLRPAVLEKLAQLPDGERLCHGDMHPGNVLLASKGEVVIDWVDATCGNPLADVARTSIILLGAAASPQLANGWAKTFVRLFHAVYLRRYFQLRPGGVGEYRRWLPVVAAARLDEGITEIEGWLLRQAQEMEPG